MSDNQQLRVVTNYQVAAEGVGGVVKLLLVVTLFLIAYPIATFLGLAAFLLFGWLGSKLGPHLIVGLTSYDWLSSPIFSGYNLPAFAMNWLGITIGAIAALIGCGAGYYCEVLLGKNRLYFAARHVWRIAGFTMLSIAALHLLEKSNYITFTAVMVGGAAAALAAHFACWNLSLDQEA